MVDVTPTYSQVWIPRLRLGTQIHRLSSVDSRFSSGLSELCISLGFSLGSLRVSTAFDSNF